MHNPWSANSRTRMALALSLIEDGSVNINKYEQITIDKSFYYGSYYADKAPGYTFTAMPAVHLSPVTAPSPTRQPTLLIFFSY